MNSLSKYKAKINRKKKYMLEIQRATRNLSCYIEISKLKYESAQQINNKKKNIEETV